MNDAAEKHRIHERFQELRSYVGWREEDAILVKSAAPILEPNLPGLIDDFYEEIERHPDAHKVITGGREQILRLKGTLLQWVRELVEGDYQESYVDRRWRVGRRHVEIGLDPLYSTAALFRLRSGLCQTLRDKWSGDPSRLADVLQALNKLLDLDLAVINEAYQSESDARLQRNERLATLGQVAGGVAHELRNPLNVVKTSVYYLLNARVVSPEKTSEHLLRIERQVGLADAVITALSNFAKMPPPYPGPARLDRCVREALEAHPPGDAVRLELDIPEELPAASADFDQIRIVLGNIVRNAYDAMPRGGTLLIRGRREGETLEIDFEDDGVGIPKSDMNKIMEPLYSTKAKGLGLGLAIAKAILDKNRGELRVESELGKGSRFTVRLGVAPTPENSGARHGPQAS